VKSWDDFFELTELEAELGESDLTQLEHDIHALELQALLSGKHDESAALLTIHAGTGGTDAQDFAQMLERMFLRFVEQGKTEAEDERVLALDRSNWQAEILEEARGEEAGIKRVVIEVRGRMAYGLLKSESGVHRLVRQSPFNAKGLRQTSFALVEVVPEVDQSNAPLVNESDLRIDIFRSGGAGGQHVNTTESAVRITHIPTGIVVAIQNERSQHQNKATAMKVLLAKLARLQELKNSEEIAMLKGEVKEGSWGNQIRSYVLHPYQLVKDHRTNAETSQTEHVLDGDLRLFIEAYLNHIHQ
jgi:peptide chain release factor 2